MTATMMTIRTTAATKAALIQAAHARGLSVGQYVAALYELHNHMRALADGGNELIQSTLTALGLQTVMR
jgi:hypothetical protein